MNEYIIRSLVSIGMIATFLSPKLYPATGLIDKRISFPWARLFLGVIVIWAFVSPAFIINSLADISYSSSNTAEPSMVIGTIRSFSGATEAFSSIFKLPVAGRT